MDDDLKVIVAERLAADDVNGAWRHVEEAAEAGLETAVLLKALSEAAVEKWHPPVPELAERAAAKPGDPDGIAALASGLLSAGAARMAAALYGRAGVLRPEDPRILGDQVAALERCGDHDGALRLLRARPQLVRGDGVLSYLYAFHLAVSGDLEGASRVDYAHAREASFLRTRMEGIFARGEALGMATPRARLATITGALAMRVSSTGVVEGPAQTAGILAGMAGALRALAAQPRVVVFPGTPWSERLAEVVSARLGAPMEPFEGAGSSATGCRLLVVFDPGDLSSERARSLRERGDLVIYAHVASSGREHELAPDLLGTYAPEVRFGSPSGDGDALFEVSPGPFEEDVPACLEVIEDPLAQRWAAIWSGEEGWRGRRDRLWAGLSR